MKRAAIIVLCTALIFSQMPTVHAVGTSASSAILMEAESGRVLYEQDSHQPRLIASITKLMTALVALESGCSLQEVFPVPEQAVGVEGSSIYLKSGEQVTLEELLYGMLLHSGNDAALAVAIHCSGSEEKFVADMNQMAQSLGMKQSHFENPNGLNAEGHYSSAYDMALLARACLKNETLAKMVGTKTITIGHRSFTNHNKLLWQYDGCVGMKTGYTERAGRTLVSAAKRDGMTLIAVTLNDPDDWKDHAALFDWGFSNYAMVEVSHEGLSLGKIPVSGSLIHFANGAAAYSCVYPVCSQDRLQLKVQWTDAPISAPVWQGEKLGTLILWCNGQMVAQVPVIADCDVPLVVSEERSPLEKILDHFS